MASQDGVVAAGDSVRNCRTRPIAEQRLLPVIGHPIPGKCEPRFTLLPARPGGFPIARPRVTGARRKRPVPAPGRQIFLVTSASSCPPGGPPVPSQPQTGSTQASFLCPSHRTPPPTTPPSPFLPPGFPTRRVPSARREKTGVPGLRAASPQRGEEEKKDSAKCPEEEPGGEGERGRPLSQDRF